MSWLSFKTKFVWTGIMSIRKATNRDVENISRLVASLAHFYLADKRQGLPEWFANTLTESEFLKRIASDEFANFVYERDNIIVAYIAMKGTRHLYHLFVEEQHQGNGIARALWQHAIQQCVSETYIVRSSLYAVAVYRKFGFVESGIVGEKEGIGFQPMELQVTTAFKA